METEKIRDLMEAYYSIYESKEEPEMEEGEEEDKEEHKGKKKGKKEKEEKDEDLEETASDPSSQLRKMRNKNFPQQKPKPLEEDADLFDYLLEYLVAEGYADTNKAALVIMANMSEEWRESIVEGIFDFLPKSKTVVPGKYGKNTVLAKKGGVEGVADKSTGSFTPQKGGWDSMDANRYADERIKQGHPTGGVNVANRRVTPNRVK